MKHHARFAINNEIKSSHVTDYSGYYDGFPIANAFDPSLAKKWVLKGLFEINQSNYKLHFSFGSGVSTTTVEWGSYTGLELAAKVAQALQLAAPTDNFLCTYETNKENADYCKFKITNDNRLTILHIANQTNAMWNTIGFIGGDIADTVFIANEERLHTSEYLELDFGYQIYGNFFGIISGGFQSVGLSETAQVKLMADNIPDNWSSPHYQLTLSNTGNKIFNWDDDKSRHYRYWRVEIIDNVNLNGPNIEIGHIYLGDFYQFTNTNISRGFTDKIEDNSTISKSVSGHKYYDIMGVTRQLSGVNFKNLHKEDLKLLRLIYETVGRHHPFYFSMDPMGIIFDDYEYFNRYVTFDSDLSYINSFSCRFDTSMVLSEVV